MSDDEEIAREGTCVRDVKTADFISAFATYLKQGELVTPPEYTSFTKTACFKEASQLVNIVVQTMLMRRSVASVERDCTRRTLHLLHVRIKTFLVFKSFVVVVLLPFPLPLLLLPCCFFFFFQQKQRSAMYSRQIHG